MDNLLMLFDEESQNRYKTVLENIQNASPSFYDSYNSLLEQFFRNICIHHVKGSVSSIIKDKMNKDFLLNDVKLDEKTYNKILDYALKLNSHKHKKQKSINMDSVLNYMKLFYDIVYAYAKFVKYTIPLYNEDYYINLYNQIEESKKEYSDIKRELNNISKHLNKKQEEEDFLRFKSEVFHCGDYNYESSLSDRIFKIRKAIIITTFLLAYVFLFIGGIYGKTEGARDFFTVSSLFMIYYGYRLIQFVLTGKIIKINYNGKTPYLYGQVSEDGFPLTLGNVKIYHYIVNILYSLTILAYITEPWYIAFFIFYLITWILLFRFKKKYTVTVMHSQYGDYYYSPKEGNIVTKHDDGSIGL